LISDPNTNYEDDHTLTITVQWLENLVTDDHCDIWRTDYHCDIRKTTVIYERRTRNMYIL